MAKQKVEGPKKKRQSGRRKTKAELAEIEKKKNQTQEPPTRDIKSIEDMLNDTAVMGIFYDGLLVTAESDIDVSRATIIIDRNHPDAEMAAEALSSTGANVILDERVPAENPSLSKAPFPEPDPHFGESLPGVDYIYPADDLFDSTNPMFAANLLASREDAKAREREYSEAERRRMLEADMEYARMFAPNTDKYAGMSKTEEYERRAVDFINSTARKTRTRLNKAQQLELLEIYNFLFALNEKRLGCDLCFIRYYSSVEKYLRKKKLI
jgi:hypothetical protein